MNRIRTWNLTFLRKLSEYGLLSDTRFSFSSRAVRMPASFGHGTSHFFASCPNAGFFRTWNPPFLHGLSECRLLSDLEPSFDSRTVRMRASFGHGIFLFFASCPNVDFFRTRDLPFLHWLSECRLLSDTESSFSSRAVRMPASFGHGIFLFFASCPNAGFFRHRLSLQDCQGHMKRRINSQAKKGSQ
jgi:hypothetical protein